VRLKIRVVSGAGTARAVVLRPGETKTVGRSAEADLRIVGDDCVSRLHCAVEWTGSECRLRDLNSSNGTLIGGKRVETAVIAPGDEWVAGETHLRIDLDREAEAARPRLRESVDAEAGAVNRQDTARAHTNPPWKPMPGVAENRSAAVDERSALLQLVQRNARRPYRDALGDESAAVRSQALYAAVWARRPWVLDYCLEVAKAKSLADWEPLYLLAVLGGAEHLPVVLSLGHRADLGPRRISLLGAFGHPRVVPVVIEYAASDDSELAAAAGRAFVKITGMDVPSSAAPIGAKGEEDEEEPLLVPDSTVLHALWKQHERRFAQGVRWCRGVDLSGPVESDAANQLDLESRFELAIRTHYSGSQRSEHPAFVRPGRMEGRGGERSAQAVWQSLEGKRSKEPGG